jgi:lipopolysaccharide transport system ATP-binding protein
MNTVIKVENLSKQYRLGLVGASTFKEDTKRWWAKMLGKEDPFLTIGSENDRTVKDDAKFVWSLKDINFDVQQGDVFGVIGSNGAGKSTLLKILSKVTAPTTGLVKVKGRVASLLEVGTGFHPELTGRENIYLNGAILGMRKLEITRKLDEIISFAGVEKYVDTPVKRYSSGMYIRLAFAVAAYLESEILIVDEVLAVGDVEFQEKCLGKIGEISSGQGRTVFFVSHNMESIKKLCNQSILLKNGLIELIDKPAICISKYTSHFRMNFNENHANHFIKSKLINSEIETIEAEVVDCHNERRELYYADEDIYLNLKIQKNKLNIESLYGYIQICNENDDVILESDTYDNHDKNIIDKLTFGLNSIQIKIPKRILPVGKFFIYLNFSNSLGTKNIDSPFRILKFSIIDPDLPRGNNRKAFTSAIAEWKIL